MSEWNLSDPDAPKVYYDLGEWDFEQQAELTSSLADAEIPHAWEGTELVVPEEFEEQTDQIFVDVEQRLDVQGRGVPDAGPYIAPDEPGDDEPAPREITADTTLTEYDLDEWDQLERDLVADSLNGSNIPFRWEGATLLVPTDDEATVDTILDDIESGEVIAVPDDEADGADGADGGEDDIPFESLNSFFLAGERLRKDARDADGLERLLEALEIADPGRPPRGVELRVWRRSCELAEQLADSLVDFADGDGEDDPDAAEDAAKQIALDLHDLLRPLI